MGARKKSPHTLPPITHVLAFDGARGESGDDLALEDEYERNQWERNQHRRGQDIAPRQLELGVTAEAGDRRLHGSGASLGEGQGIEILIPGGDKCKETGCDQPWR